MEEVEGLTLAQWLERKRRRPAEVLDVMIAAGRGLAAAHAEGLVHRDFKPDNIMIGDDGRVIVMDFGLAREVDKGDLAESWELAGTPAYMAPEQILGQPADARSDQFAFCVSLWEALHGERPFAGATAQAVFLSVTQNELQAPPRGRAAAGLAAARAPAGGSRRSRANAIGACTTCWRPCAAAGIGRCAGLSGSAAPPSPSSPASDCGAPPSVSSRAAPRGITSRDGGIASAPAP